MGLFMDILEDVRDNMPPIEPILSPPLPRYQVKRERVTTVSCPACAEAYASKERLQQHLFDRHRGGGFYLRVEGRIVQDVAFLDRVPKRLEFVPLGADEINLTISYSATPRSPIEGNVPAGESLNLLNLIPLTQNSRGVLSITSNVRGYTKTYLLHLIQPPQLDFRRLDALVFDAQEPLTVGQRPSLSVLERMADSAHFSHLEQRYLRGFAELLLGSEQELFDTNWRGAKERWEQAFGLLRIFTSDLARSARALMAFRMNAFPAIIALGQASTFWHAAHYFLNPRGVIASAPVTRPSHHGLWMDEYQEGLLRVVEAATLRDWNAASAALQELRDGPQVHPSNTLKRQLLSARVATALGDKERARAAYDDLRWDPVFGEEARASH